MTIKYQIRKIIGSIKNNPKNIYHCCVQKTGSQWVKAILSDELILKRTRMALYNYNKYLPTKVDTRRLTEITFNESFPENCIISPLYINYHNYISIPKPEHYKTFFIMRDPRDILISWYFSVKHSHPLVGRIPIHREKLNQTSMEEGLIYSMKYLKSYGLFEALKSWVKRPEDDLNVRLVHFEDIVDLDRQCSVFADIFSHCCISINSNEIKRLLNKYRFSRMQLKTNKKKQRISHYRKGIPGDWKKHFNEQVTAAFKKHLGDLIKELGYSE